MWWIWSMYCLFRISIVSSIHLLDLKRWNSEVVEQFEFIRSTKRVVEHEGTWDMRGSWHMRELWLGVKLEKKRSVHGPYWDNGCSFNVTLLET